MFVRPSHTSDSASSVSSTAASLRHRLPNTTEPQPFVRTLPTQAQSKSIIDAIAPLADRTRREIPTDRLCFKFRPGSEPDGQGGVKQDLYFVQCADDGKKKRLCPKIFN